MNTNNGIPVGTTALTVGNSAITDQQGNEIKIGMDSSSNVGLQNQAPTNTSTPSAAATPTISTKNQPISNSSSDAGQQVLTKQKLQDIVREIDGTLNLEEEVEEIILNYVDEFVDRCLNGAALIAKNRRVQTIEVKDVQQFLTRNYNMWTPGFGTDELKPYKRSLTTEAHKHRTALIKKTLRKY